MNFDFVTPYYDALARLIFGRRLQRAQAVFLHRILPGASVLMVGGGTGWLLGPVLKRCQPKPGSPGPSSRPGHLIYLESSAGMLDRASRRMVQKPLVGSVEFRLGDETALRPDEQFDVVLTPFVLDLFHEETLRTNLIRRLANVLRPGGLLLVTDFVQSPVWWHNALIRAMIRFFRLTAGIETRQLADWQQLLAETGLVLRQRRKAVNGVVSAEVWERLG